MANVENSLDILKNATAENDIIIKLTENVNTTEAYTIVGNVNISADSPVTITNTVTDVFTVVEGGKLTLGENITIESNTSVLYANGGDIVIDGATINVTDSQYAAAFVDAGCITVENGGINQSGTNNVTISADGVNAKVVVNGGKVTSANSSTIASKNNANIIINGGVVKTTCEEPTYCAVYSHSNGSVAMNGGEVSAVAGYGLVAANAGKVKMTGGTVNGGVKSHESSDATVEIYGGTVNGDVSALAGATLVVTGGNFNVDVSAYMNETSEVVYDEATDTYTIIADNKFKVVATTGEKIDNLPVKNGQLIFVQDTKQIAFDFKGVRVVYDHSDELDDIYSKIATLEERDAEIETKIEEKITEINTGYEIVEF